MLARTRVISMPTTSHYEYSRSSIRNTVFVSPRLIIYILAITRSTFTFRKITSINYQTHDSGISINEKKVRTSSPARTSSDLTSFYFQKSSKIDVLNPREWTLIIQLKEMLFCAKNSDGGNWTRPALTRLLLAREGQATWKRPRSKGSSTSAGDELFSGALSSPEPLELNWVKRRCYRTG